MPHEPVVYVVDDDDSVRRSVAWLVGQAGFTVTCFASATAFLDALATEERPGCLITDVRMPDMDGLELQRRLVGQGSRLRLIVITAHGDVPMAVAAMKAGAVDFLTKPFGNQALLDLVQRCVMESTDAHTTCDHKAAAKRLLDDLTRRERQVLDLVLEGKTSKMIAHHLGLSVKTIEVHRSRVMAKVGANSLADLMQRFRPTAPR